MLDRARLFLAVGIAAVLTGCTTPSAPTGAGPSPSSAATSAATVGDTSYPVYEGSWDEWTQDFMTCMRDAGWQIEQGNPNDGISFEYGYVDDTQTASLVGSQETCTRSIGRIPEPEMTDAALTEFYGRLLEHYNCLAAAGYSPREAPTVEVYIDRQRSGVATWDPMEGVPGSDYDAALAACPRPMFGQ